MDKEELIGKIVRLVNDNGGSLKTCGLVSKLIDNDDFILTTDTIQKEEYIEAVKSVDSLGLGCGLEDLNITCRYEAMQYGFEQCLERVSEQIEIK